MKIKLTFEEVVSICEMTRVLYFLRDDAAMNFYKDKITLSEAFKAENARMLDLNKRLQQLKQEAQTPDKAKKGDSKTEMKPDKDIDVLEFQQIKTEMESVYMIEKEFDITPIPYAKFKEAGQTGLEIINVFGKFISTETEEVRDGK